MATPSTLPQAPLFVADNLALDFINTEYGVGVRHCDLFVSDQSVADWLKLAGVLPPDFNEVPKGLLALARQVRESARAVVGAAKMGVAADSSVVNRVLEAGCPARSLEWDTNAAAFKLVERPRDYSAASLLEPVARALASLLTEAQLDLVRQCGADDCTLLFHDLTKSHRRRWCSMAACGNRMKVAAFRSRQRPD